jgi:uncharacterized protein (TIGR02453 family)
MSDGFTGFPREAFTFFATLAKHNDREWFHAHKDVYERCCREPMKALMAAIDPPLGAGWMSRINNDMRFNRDRAPYKTRIEAGVKGHYVSVGAQGMYVGAGIYRPEPAVLRTLRESMAADVSGKKLQAIVAALRRKGYTVATHESSAGPPRGYPADHPRIELLKMKDIHAGRMLEPGVLSTPKALAHVKRVIADLKPFSEWMKTYVAAGL